VVLKDHVARVRTSILVKSKPPYREAGYPDGDPCPRDKGAGQANGGVNVPLGGGGKRARGPGGVTGDRQTIARDREISVQQLLFG